MGVGTVVDTSPNIGEEAIVLIDKHCLFAQFSSRRSFSIHHGGDHTHLRPTPSLLMKEVMYLQVKRAFCT